MSNSPSHNAEQTTGMRPSDRWIPWYFVAFFVGLALISSVFVYLAVTTHTGVVTQQAYEKGLNYNATIAASEKGQALGWQGAAKFTPVSSATAGMVSLTVATENEALVGATVTASVSRPTQDGYDFTLTLQEQEKGTYRADVIFPLAGQWDMRFFVKRGVSEHQLSERFIVKP